MRCTKLRLTKIIHKTHKNNLEKLFAEMILAKTIDNNKLWHNVDIINSHLKHTLKH